MRSIWMQIVLLLIYFLSVFLISRMLELVLWYQHGISSTQIVDPLVLSVRQLKQLLENRGVSYTGYVEKQELAHLVGASAEVMQGEVEELRDAEGNVSSRERLVTTPPASRFTGGPHFFEEVEDTKDSVWLVQVVPADKQNAPLLDDYSWRMVCNQMAPFAIRTGIFECKLDRKLCISKGWHQPLLLLALPKGTKAKDKVILSTSTSTRLQPIVDWVRNELSIHVKTINDIEEVQQDWLQQASPIDNTTTTDNSVKVLLLSHLFSPPLFLAALSIKFTGRITFGIFTVKKEESETVRKKLKLLDHKIPTYFVITPERKLVYGLRRFEHFNFKAMHLFLRAVQPEMNDVFLCTLVLVNMLVSLQIFQVSVRLWWKHIARCLWTVISYNFWLFSVWLLILATYRFSLVTSLADTCVVVVRYLSLTDVGSMLRADWLSLSHHPYLLFFTFFLYGWAATWLLKWRYSTEIALENENEQPWWEVLPVDSYWINCFFRPMNSVSRQLPTSEVELEEGIDMLIERLAVPNLWLQPVIASEYIKDLPVWKHCGWDQSLPKAERKQSVNLPLAEQEAIKQLMDAEGPSCTMCRGCNAEREKHAQYNRKNTGIGTLKCNNITLRQCPSGGGTCNETCGSVDEHPVLVPSFQNCEELCNCAPPSNSSLRPSNSICPSCASAKLTVLSADRGATAWGLNSASEDSSSDDGGVNIPSGMRPTSECAVCLESYDWGALLCGLPCGHSYHQCCIMVWLQRDNHHCPVCRWPAYKAKQMPTHYHKEFSRSSSDSDHANLFTSTSPPTPSTEPFPCDVAS